MAEKLNNVNDEKLTNKKDKEINEDILDIEFEPFNITKKQQSYEITKSFGVPQNTNLKNTVLEFFYNEKLDEKTNPIFVYALYNYFTNLKKKLGDALHIPKIKKGLR